MKEFDYNLERYNSVDLLKEIEKQFTEQATKYMRSLDYVQEARIGYFFDSEAISVSILAKALLNEEENYYEENEYVWDNDSFVIKGLEKLLEDMRKQLKNDEKAEQQLYELLKQMCFDLTEKLKKNFSKKITFEDPEELD